MEPLQEIELISLAEYIGPGKYSKLCNALGYTYAVSQSHIVKHLNNVTEALVELLIKWNNNQRDSTQSRSTLASKLHELRLGDLGDRLSEGKYLPNQQEPHDHKSTPVQTRPGKAAHGGIADTLLFKLAEDIETAEQMEALGRALGFKAAAIDIYTDTNNKGDRVTCKGTCDMLFDWRQTVKPCDQHLRLEQALIDTKLVMLADTHLSGTSSIPGMATHGGIADTLLFKLSEDIETGEQMEALGRALGFEAAAIDIYTDTNNTDYRVTCKGTRDMLFDWRQTVEPCYQHLRLEQALIAAKLVMLANTHLNRTSSIPDIYSKRISESLTVQQCREKLENKYRNQLCKIQMTPWNQSDYAEFEDMHTVVTMVKKDGRGKDTKKKKLLKGSVAEIFSTKVNGKLPVRILISAPAGRGKTTAVAKIAYDWIHRESGSALEHLPLLFVVKFRNTSQITTIGEAIKSQLLSDVDDLTPEGLERFIKENQGICHIILDGLDEYAGLSSSQSSSLSNIVSVIRWKEFPECRVLVTTRPHLENFFNQDDLQRVYTKMWIEGFSRESSCEYIDKFFVSTSNPCKGQSLKNYLDEQPLIDELVKTPLFCLMICHLWSEGLLDIGTTTQTELLDKVNVFLMHYANERSHSRMKITRAKLKEIISQLGKVALTGLLDDAKKLVFRPHDFREVSATLDRACELGVVSKTTVNITCLPQSIETTSTTIEFYHKLAQEHSAGKFLADQTHRSMLLLKISKLDKVLRKIKANIGDYENLIRFAAGTDNSLCIRIMEALLANTCLNESERYRIILDCSSETKLGTEGNVSLLVQRCVNSQGIVLKAPTVYTVIGIQNLPKQLKREVRSVKFEGSTLTTDVTSGLWSCLESFTMLHTLTISDSSLSFLSSPPELLSVTKLSAEKVTSQTYEDVLSSIPGVRDIDVSIDVAETSNTFESTAASSSRHISQTRARDEQFSVNIRLHAWPALTTDSNIKSEETIGGLSLLFEDQTKSQHRLHVFGVTGRDEQALVDLFVKTKQLTYLNSGIEGGSLNKKNAIQNTMLKIEQCQLSAEMTEKLWSGLISLNPLNHLAISESSLSFPPSPPELLSVTKLSAEKLTSQSYEGVLSSIHGVRDIDVSIDVAEMSNTVQITPASSSRSISQTRTGDEQFFVHIRLHAWPALTTNRKIGSGETIGGLSLLIEDQTKDQQRLHVSGVKGRDEEALVDLFVKTKQLTYLDLGSGCGSLNKKNTVQNTRLEIEHCHLSTEMTEKLWSSLRSYTPLNQLTISDSSLSFLPSPPELTSVSKLSAKRVTSQSYEGLLSSLPGLEEVDITIGDANTEDISQIQTSLRRHLMRHDLTRINPHSFTSEGNVSSMSRMRGLGLLVGRNQLILSGVVLGPNETVIDLVQSSTRLMSASLYVERLFWSLNSDQDVLHVDMWTTMGCQLSTEMTVKLWSCLRSFTSLNQLTISDSSLSFPSSPPGLPSVIKLLAERVTSHSYEGLLASLPGLRDIDITFDDAERDIPQITAGLCLTGAQQITHITLRAPSSEKNSVSSGTMRELGLLIREQMKNLQLIYMSGVKCTDEEDLLFLIESCRCVKTMSKLWLEKCGNTEGDRLAYQLPNLHTSDGRIVVWVMHDTDDVHASWYRITHTT